MNVWDVEYMGLTFRDLTSHARYLYFYLVDCIKRKPIINYKYLVDIGLL